MEPIYYSYLPEEIKSPRFSFFKSISLVVVFVMLTPIALSVSIFSLIFLSANSQPEKPAVLALNTQSVRGANIFAALPDYMPSVEGIVGHEDARAEVIREYLEKYDSPLAPYAKHIVNAADENELDFRLITAIAQQESNLCKKIPEGTHNCWGWGIHSQGTLGFESYEQAINVVSKGIKREYINKGYTTPEEIMGKYTPSSNGSWAFGVRTFLEDMK